VAGLVPVVRPLVVPNIRPQVSTTDFPQADQQADPGVGRTILTGNDGEVLDLSYNFSRSMQKQRNREEKRKYDIARIYRVIPAAASAAAAPGTTAAPTIDKSTYVDVEIPHRIQLRERNSKGPQRLDVYRQPKAEDYPNGNVEILERDLVRENPKG
jgi:hypothetical protein